MSDYEQTAVNMEGDAGLDRVDTEISTATTGTPDAALRAVLAHAFTTTATTPSFSTGVPLPNPPSSASLPRSSSQSNKHTRIPSEILPRLFISDIFTAVNAPTLRSFRITHIISVIEYAVAFPSLPQPRAESGSLDQLSLQLPEPMPLALTTLHVPLTDSPAADIFSYFTTTRDFITTALKDEHARVLVHCYKGQSRSPTIVAAYLISTLKISTSDALRMIEAKRPIILPNPGFQRQLEQWEVILSEEEKMVYSDK